MLCTRASVYKYACAKVHVCESTCTGATSVRVRAGTSVRLESIHAPAHCVANAPDEPGALRYIGLACRGIAALPRSTQGDALWIRGDLFVDDYDRSLRRYEMGRVAHGQPVTRATSNKTIRIREFLTNRIHEVREARLSEEAVARGCVPSQLAQDGWALVREAGVRAQWPRRIIRHDGLALQLVCMPGVLMDVEVVLRSEGLPTVSARGAGARFDNSVALLLRIHVLIE